MQVYGVDLAVWFREKRWVALLELIDGLPSASRFNEAISNDPELAEIIAKQPDSSEPWTPRVLDQSLTNIILARIADGIAVLKETQIATTGGKPSQIKPFPTPRTAIDRAKEAHEKQFVSDVLGLLGYDDGDF